MRDMAENAGFRSQTPAGELLGPFNALLYSPELANAMLVYQQTEARLTSVSRKLREVVILTVGAVWKSPYELYAHDAVARSLGISAGDVALMCAGKPPINLGEEGALAQRFIMALIKEHDVSDELYSEALAQFGHKPLIDMMHLAGLYTTVCALLNAFRVPAG